MLSHVRRSQMLNCVAEGGASGAAAASAGDVGASGAAAVVTGGLIIPSIVPLSPVAACSFVGGAGALCACGRAGVSRAFQRRRVCRGRAEARAVAKVAADPMMMMIRVRLRLRLPSTGFTSIRLCSPSRPALAACRLRSRGRSPPPPQLGTRGLVATGGPFLTILSAFESDDANNTYHIVHTPQHDTSARTSSREWEKTDAHTVELLRACRHQCIRGVKGGTNRLALVVQHVHRLHRHRRAPRFHVAVPKNRTRENVRKAARAMSAPPAAATKALKRT